ncbi:MAG: C2H2-type zinc finger protein, partial [Halodesulfurarchaeum sp.]
MSHYCPVCGALRGNGACSNCGYDPLEDDGKKKKKKKSNRGFAFDGGTAYECEYCGRLFLSSDALNGHKSNCQPEEKLVTDGGQVIEGNGLPPEEVPLDLEPGKMSTGPIRSELATTVSILNSGCSDERFVEVMERQCQLWAELEERVDPNYPRCQHCGEDSEWINEFQGFVFCDNCGTNANAAIARIVRKIQAAVLAGDIQEVVDKELVTDGGLPDDNSIRCYDCERVVDRRNVQFHEVPIENKNEPGYEYVPVPLCRSCELRRFGVKCDHCGEYHQDHEAVFECKRDRPGLIPDGGRRCVEIPLSDLHRLDIGDEVVVEFEYYPNETENRRYDTLSGEIVDRDGEPGFSEIASVTLEDRSEVRYKVYRGGGVHLPRKGQLSRNIGYGAKLSVVQELATDG